MITSLLVLLLAEIHMTKRNAAYLAFLRVRYQNRPLDSFYLTFHYCYLTFMCLLGLDQINASFLWVSYALMMSSSFLLLYSMWSADRVWSSFTYEIQVKKSPFRWLKKPEQTSRFLLAVSFALVAAKGGEIWPLVIYPIYSLLQAKPMCASDKQNVHMKKQLR